MFLQKKEYIRLFRGNEKLMTAGLCKLVIWDQRIKVDYYMDHLPLANETEGNCHLLYLVSREGEQNLIQRESVFSLVFEKSKFHYTFQTRENKDYKIVKIEDCYIELEGNHRILMHASPMRMKQLKSADSDIAENMPGSIAAETPENIPGSNAAEIAGNTPENRAAEVSGNMPENGSEDAGTDAPENAAPYPVRRIDDLKELLTMGNSFVELYYNSFLLHSFYQYRHFLLGKDFLGVPGYFYEREAIAAKMMGFPYFIEAEHADNCCLKEEKRTDKPIEGSYGYFIRSIGA